MHTKYRRGGSHNSDSGTRHGDRPAEATLESGGCRARDRDDPAAGSAR